MKENEILDRIRESAASSDIPDSLEPEKILKTLKTQKAGRKKPPIYTLGLAAAAVLLCVCVWSVNRFTPPDTSSSVSLTEDDKTEAAVLTENEDAMEAQTEAATEARTETASAEMPGSGNEASHAPGTDAFPSAKSYDEIYKALKQGIQDDMQLTSGIYSSSKEAGEGTTEIATEAAQEGSMATDAVKGTGSDFDTTNLRTEGVDEGDILKNDGKYLYILDSSGKISIIPTGEETLKPIGTISPSSLDEESEEFYVNDDTLILITELYETEMKASSSKTAGTSSAATEYYKVRSGCRVTVYVYDISDRTSPKLTGTSSQDGSFGTSRRIGDYLYTMSFYYPEIGNSESDSRYIPKVEGTSVPYDDFYIPDYQNNIGSMVISSVNLKNPGKILDQKVVLSGAGVYYASTNSLYICNTDYRNETAVTQILKFRFQEGQIVPFAAGNVSGTIENSFFVDEYNKNLRAVTSDFSKNQITSTLCVLDENLKLTGRIDNLAPGESLRSCRFLGNTGYFVTYKNVDPLFSVNLSDPENPRILGELKITGFSSYLHPYGENLLLGIGKESDPDTGEETGVKLSMFDISDPSNVKEVHKYVVENALYTPSESDYKSILIHPGKNLFGFEIQISDQSGSGKQCYMTFSYSEKKGFINEFTHALSQKDSLEYSGVRGTFTDQTFYLTYGSKMGQKLESYNIKKDYKKQKESLF